MFFLENAPKSLGTKVQPNPRKTKKGTIDANSTDEINCSRSGRCSTLLLLALNVVVTLDVWKAVHPTSFVAAIQRELRTWDENRFIECIFCMDYDDYQRLSIFGCVARNPPTCFGNACYMRQHKRGNTYFLYTSGCLNLTQREFNEIHTHTLTARAERGDRGVETQLCEVTPTINTCVCANRAQCNNVSSMEPFTEYASLVFGNTNFDEVAHFRHFLPNDPMLRTSGHAPRYGGGASSATDVITKYHRMTMAFAAVLVALWSHKLHYFRAVN